MHNNIYDKNKVFEKMGVYPENVQGWLALVGDNSDNVPGVDKIGPDTAAKLLNQYGNLQELIKNSNDIKGVRGENLRASIASGQLDKSYQLVQLKTDCEIKVTKEQLTMKEVNVDLWNDFCNSMNMSSLIKKKSTTPNI